MTESGLLPTFKASDVRIMDCPSERNRKSPCSESMVNIWPTPKALDWNKRRSVSHHPRNGLLDAVVRFPTPIASVSSKWDNQSLSKLKVKGRQIRLSTAVSLQGVNGGRLNPNWGVADGVANRADRLKTIGNEQVSIVAKSAFEFLGEGL